MYGKNYEVNLGKFGSEADSPFPAGVETTEFKVEAELKATHVPAASVEANFALRDFKRGGETLNTTVLAFKGVKTSVECGTVDETTTSTAVDALWLRNQEGALEAITDLPTVEKPLERKDLPFGAPLTVEGAVTSKSDIKISPVTKFDQLIRLKSWLESDVNAAAGWQVDIVTHAVDAEGKVLEGKDVTTRLVLGGASCSVPKDFVATEEDPVPTAVPAGYAAPAAPGESGTSPLGFTLLGAGALLAGGAAFVVRRRRHDH
ncbi:LPXTG cell wall anchor domain-containing protein [Amycolatopsis sp. cg5]|uniref:LPXTG cell wall anchor domain-containing protein n=1 Tax=Amycolatopsis sp. cg5 TaxID=3238802 RepID=UPI003523B9C3